MAFIRAKIIKGVNYYYLVENKRIDGKVKQKILQYFGTTLPDVYSMVKKSIVVPTVKRHAVVAKEAVQRVSPTKTKGKFEPSKVSTTPVKVINNLVSATKAMGKVEPSVVVKPVSTTAVKVPDRVSTTPLDIQIILQRRAAALNVSAEGYLKKLLRISPDGKLGHHGVDRKTGKKY